MGQLQGFSRFDKTEVEKLKPSNVVRYKGEMYGIVDEAARDVLESKQDKLVPGKGIKLEGNIISVDDNLSGNGANKTIVEQQELKSGLGVKIDNNEVSMNVKAGKGVSMTENKDGSITIDCTLESSEQTVIQETDYANVPNINFATW